MTVFKSITIPLISNHSCIFSGNLLFICIVSFTLQHSIRIGSSKNGLDIWSFITVFHEELTQRKTLGSAVTSAPVHTAQIQSYIRALQSVFSCKSDFGFLWTDLSIYFKWCLLLRTSPKWSSWQKSSHLFLSLDSFFAHSIPLNFTLSTLSCHFNGDCHLALTATLDTLDSRLMDMNLRDFRYNGCHLPLDKQTGSLKKYIVWKICLLGGRATGVNGEKFLLNQASVTVYLLT